MVVNLFSFDSLAYKEYYDKNGNLIGIDYNDRYYADPSSITITRGDSYKIKACAEQDGKVYSASDVEWSSSSPSIAYVDQNGVVTGGLPGVATITFATKNFGNTGTCVVTVEDYKSKVSTITSSKDVIYLEEGDVYFLEVYCPIGDIALDRGTSDYSVATVSRDYTESKNEEGIYVFRVKALSEGVATLSFESYNTGKMVTCEVAVGNPTPTPTPVIEDTIDMYRLYNPNSGEHFYTASESEKNMLDGMGWNYEGVAWKAPTSGDPVYRSYNPNNGDHHYTTNGGERDSLVAAVWSDEGVGWYSSALSFSVPMYRLYNPNATGAGSHHYTTNASEKNQLVSIGWKDEGYAWYGR